MVDSFCVQLINKFLHLYIYLVWIVKDIFYVWFILNYKKNSYKTLNESVSSQFLELGRGKKRQQLKDYFFVGLMLR